MESFYIVVAINPEGGEMTFLSAPQSFADAAERCTEAQRERDPAEQLVIVIQAFGTAG